MIIPEEFVIQKFYQHAGYPKYVKSTNTYMGGCPVCREGSSWGRKSRCYYIPKDCKICCHNCGWYSKPVDWIIEVEQITYKDLVHQVDECDYSYGVYIEEPKPEVRRAEDLPIDSINLFDKFQLSYYVNEDIVKLAAKTIIERGLNKAVNKPKAMYVSMVDPVHKNRLVIPFYDKNKTCTFYQSRKLLQNDPKPKYLSKVGSEKTLFNYDNLESGTDHVFVTEGPIDSYFIRNSVAVAGIQESSKQTFTSIQQNQIDRLFLSKIVWVLDSQWLDTASRQKTETLLRSGECVFLWPKSVGTRFKDVNDLCQHFRISELSEQYILDNTYCGLKGIVKLKQIT